MLQQGRLLAVGRNQPIARWIERERRPEHRCLLPLERRVGADLVAAAEPRHSRIEPARQHHQAQGGEALLDPERRRAGEAAVRAQHLVHHRRLRMDARDRGGAGV